MSVLIKLILYLAGAIALLGVLVAPVPTKVGDRPTVATTTPAASVATTSPKTRVEKKPLPTTPAVAKPAPPKVAMVKAPTETPVPVATTNYPASPAGRQLLATSSLPTLSWNQINEETRAALVNVICTTPRGGSFKPVSGSGVVIDPRGVILTNAHVAQYFLLKDYLVQDFVECLIRTGAPAVNAYKARLLYLAPQWIEKNAEEITQEEATGTGKDDFALLLVTESTRPNTPLPANLPFLSVDWGVETIKEARSEGYALVAGYPAGFLGGIAIQRDLNPVSSVATLSSSIYSFSTTQTPDLLEVTGSPLAQEGSSGGAVVGHNGELIGIIATASVGKTTGERVLHAITPSHIARSFKERNAFSIQEFFAESDLVHLAHDFNEKIAPALITLLSDALAPEK